MDKKLKVYLGDSVYADFDGFHIVLTTENGYGASNTICLEDSVYAALESYAHGVFAARKKKDWVMEGLEKLARDKEESENEIL